MILPDTSFFEKKKKTKFLEKCRWHFDFVLSEVEECSLSQGPDGGLHAENSHTKARWAG